MTRNEQHKIAVKKREWDGVMRPIEKWFRKYWRKVKLFIKKYMLRWYFCYQPEDNGSLALHIFCVLAVDLLILRVFGLI